MTSKYPSAPSVQTRPPPEPQISFLNLPAHDISPIPRVIPPVTYSFSRVSSKSMVLLHPADSRPRYHISVSFNCFIPSSWITAVHRGPPENRDFVGEFEMGICEKQGTVSLRGIEMEIKLVLDKTGSRKNGFWTWFCPGKRNILTWAWTAQGGLCQSSAGQLAKFTPASTLRHEGNTVDLAQLEVFPEGQDDFDDILMSALIIERKTLTPGHSEDTKELFS